MAKKYKMKTNKSAAKRFSFTATGKLKRKKSGLRHFMRRKSAASKRNLRKAGYVRATEMDRMNALMPYGG
ncbi:MAG: 50S ribosomal protein L35 [Deltaproteobacteria bacterium]|nr:50S ribosomal protein L35 [Deltaproteobacteria bacterium]